jgi:arylsulfatase A-like enzyme
MSHVDPCARTTFAMRLVRALCVSIACVALFAGGLACGDDEKAPSQEEKVVAPAVGATPAAVPADQPGTDDGLRPHMNLQSLAHLADVEQGGLFLDFGSPARLKYTSGQFKTGWLKDGKEGDTAFTYVGASGRVYLPLELQGQGPLALRIRLKSLGTKNLQLFVNNEMLPAVRLDAQPGFAEHEIALPDNVVHAGENQVLLRFGGTTKLEGEEVAAAVDYIRVVRAGAAPSIVAALPTHASLVRDVAIGDEKRKALALAAPGTLSFYVDVPAKASLSLRVGQASGSGATAKVRVTPEGEAAKEIFSQALTAKWQDKVVSLDAFAGKVVRLELSGEGAGEVAWSSPSIVVPKVELAEVAPAKNVIVLLIDTLPAKKLRAYDGKSRVETPVLDNFAREGTVFERAQSPENWTKPSVASVLTGLYPMTHRTKESESKLSANALMVSEVFKEAGLATATFLANGYVSDKFGFAQGWDHYTNYIRENKSSAAENVFKEAGNWIEANKDKRFFVYIQTIDPHVPYDPPEDLLKKYDSQPYNGVVSPRKTPDQLEQAKRNPPALKFNERDIERLHALYDGEVSYHDVHFGRFLDKLRALGIYDQTAFVITSDHGEEFNEHGSYGHGHSMYQELLHVPLIARQPGVVPAGKRVPETVGTLDISPTVLAMAGVKIPEVMEGNNRLPHARGDVPALPAVGFSDFLDDRRAIRAGRYKLILRGVNATLFDLVNDPNEKTELPIDKHPIAMRYCRVMLGQFLGARDRRNWLSAEQKEPAIELKQEATEMDEKTRGELKALGYAN